MRCGLVAFAIQVQCRNCPRNCQRQAVPPWPLGFPWEGVDSVEPQVRRPAVDPLVRWAGCLGDGRLGCGCRRNLRCEADTAPRRFAREPWVAVFPPLDSLLPESAPDDAPGPEGAPDASRATSEPACGAASLALASAPERAITIYVCVTCRAGRPLDLVPVPGDVLADATARAAVGTGMTVRRIRCLANCNRGLSAAVRRDGAWTYVFGHLDPANPVAAAAALVEGASLFARSPDGLMPWRGRPDALKRGLIARTPPFDFAGEPG